MSGSLRLLPAPRELQRSEGQIRLAQGSAPLRAEMADAVIDSASGLPAQGYELLISETEVRITAADALGLLYGRSTLDQILDQCGSDLPILRIRDWPDFPVRGYMLDISRDRVPTQAALLEIVDLLAALRINQLQLYTEHSFAYPAHHAVWENASPLTADEVRELDAYCGERGIELVANQNSFGHMERWLAHEAYRHLAEDPDAERPSCLAPNESSLAFMRGLYDELLPCFSSRVLNIGCDETFELGRGRSRAACETRGRGRVYLDFLLRLIRELHGRGYAVQFWGDIVRAHPELVSELPRENLTALVWGYEAPQDPARIPESVHAILARYDVPPESFTGFEWRLEPFAEAKLPFYVCPGTSAWNSLIGRWPNARENLLDAARAGLAHGASGYLITDWGDNGHLQPPIISLLPIAFGAAVSWCAATNADVPIETALRPFIGGAGDSLPRALVALGSVHTKLGLQAMNASPLALGLLRREEEPLLVWGETDRERLTLVIEEIEHELGKLAGAPEPHPLPVRELIHAAELARHGAWRLGRRMLETGPNPAELANDLERLIGRQAELWRERSRPGGLEDSLERLRRLRQDPRSTG